MNLVWPAIKAQMRRRLAHVLGRPTPPDPPRSINCRHLTFDDDGSPRWVENEGGMPVSGKVYVPVWYCVLTVPDASGGISMFPLTPVYYSYAAAEAQQHWLSKVLPNCAVQGSSLFFDAGDPEHRRLIERCRHKCLGEMLKY